MKIENLEMLQVTLLWPKEVEAFYEIVDFFVENGPDKKPDSTFAWKIAVQLQEYIDANRVVPGKG